MNIFTLISSIVENGCMHVLRLLVGVKNGMEATTWELLEEARKYDS